MTITSRTSDATVDKVDARAYTVPTDAPESDGTLEWLSTTVVVVEASGAGHTGIGYTYTAAAAARVIDEMLASAISGVAVLDTRRAWSLMGAAVRNVGSGGLVAAAISAVDAALWDLKARCLDVSLVDLLGATRDGVPVYGSGGFTSYDDGRLAEQLAGWAHHGMGQVKIKVGRDPRQDERRMAVARDAIGPDVMLYVDANGGYQRAEALWWAERFGEAGVRWLEEPVSSDDLEGLRQVRDRAPAGLDITAGEYGDGLDVFKRMLDAGAVDVLQIDATRCGGITGFLDAAVLARAHGIQVSAHCAPTLHLAPCCAVPELRHIEWFWDHTRLEPMLFDGVPEPVNGVLRADRDRPGMGIELKGTDAERFAV